MKSILLPTWLLAISLGSFAPIAAIGDAPRLPEQFAEVVLTVEGMT